MQVSPALVYLSSVSDGSKITIINSLQIIVGYLNESKNYTYENYPWWEIDYRQMVGIKAYLQQKYAVSTANKILSFLKSVLRECKSLGLISADSYDNVSSVKQIRGSVPKKNRFVTREEFLKLIDASGKNKKYLCLLAIFSLGLRINEIVNLQIEDFNVADQTLRVSKGKGNKVRTIPVPKFQYQLILDFINSQAKSKYIFSRGSGKYTTRALSNCLDKIRLKAGVNKFTPHDLRGACASWLLESGVDIAIVQRILGHSNINTTVRYDRRNEDTVRAAMDFLSLK